MCPRLNQNDTVVRVASSIIHSTKLTLVTKKKTVETNAAVTMINLLLKSLFLLLQKQ